MNLDERLEALTPTLELFAGMQRDQEARFNREIGEISQNIDRITALMAETGQFINQLARIGEAHERRLDNHNSRPDELESH